MQNPFRYFNSSPEVIRLAVMMYIRYPLSLRQVEDLLFERGIDICHETVRFWWNRFGPMFAAEIRKQRLHHRSDLRRFVTLSPVPGFRKWRARFLKDEPLGILEAEQRAKLECLGTEDWFRDQETADDIRAVLVPLASYYFLRAKNSRGEPVDPVARFHLGNGARLERINWLGDTSEGGLKAGAGLMVNYRYEIRDIEKNHEAFANHGEISASSDVSRLLRQLSQSRALV